MKELDLGNLNKHVAVQAVQTSHVPGEIKGRTSHGDRQMPVLFQGVLSLLLLPQVLILGMVTV